MLVLGALVADDGWVVVRGTVRLDRPEHVALGFQQDLETLEVWVPGAGEVVSHRGLEAVVGPTGFTSWDTGQWPSGYTSTAS